MAIKFIYFDAGGVLFHFRSGLREIALKHNLNYVDFERVFRKYDDQVVKGFISPQQLWENYQQELGFRETNVNFLDYWVSKLQPISETHQLLKELIQAGYAVGLITNLYAGVFEQAVKLGHIPNLPYSAIIQSSLVHAMKPELEIYQYAQGKSEAKPEEVLFIDDKPEFLTVPQTMGWKTIQFMEDNPIQSISLIKKVLNSENLLL